MKRIIFFIYFFIFVICGNCFAQVTTAADIERTQVIIQKDEAFKQVINKPEKIHIKDIVLDGVTLLSEEQIKSIISPFKGGWLSENEIQGVINSIKMFYQKRGFSNQPENITFQVEKSVLKINIIEATQQKNK